MTTQVNDYEESIRPRLQRRATFAIVLFIASLVIALLATAGFVLVVVSIAGCSSGAGSTGDPTSAEAADGSDAAAALGITDRVDPVLPTPCDATCGADGEHTCVGPHPEVESIDLAGMCVFLCDDPMTDPGPDEICVGAGGECVVLSGGLVACIPVP